MPAYAMRLRASVFASDNLIPILAPPLQILCGMGGLLKEAAIAVVNRLTVKFLAEKQDAFYDGIASTHV